MILESLERKQKVMLTTTLAALVTAAVISIGSVLMAMNMATTERNQVYVLAGNVPMLAERAELEQNLEMECKSHIQMFHSFFFNLAPDKEQMEWTVDKALLLADESALKQRNSLQEKGFYDEIIQSAAYLSIIADTIDVDVDNMTWRYVGTQIIKRRSNTAKRRLVTAGKIHSVQRSANNPHGLIITNWTTKENVDLKIEQNRNNTFGV